MSDKQDIETGFEKDNSVVDEEGGKYKKNNTSLLCCETYNNSDEITDNFEETSTNTLNSKTTDDTFIVDEDDLGDHQDELSEIKSNINKVNDPNVTNETNLFLENSFFNVLNNRKDDSFKKNQNISSGGIEFVKLSEVEQNDVEILHNIEDFWEANSESEDEEYPEPNSTKHLEQISFEKLKKKIYKDFEVNLIHRYSSALDILASYIKYHVIIYTEASYYCNFKLNLFMVPAILFSTVCSVITGVTHNRDNMAIVVASLNGFIAFLLAIINYLKLDASAEAHKISAYQYSKLKNYIEFSSGEILLFQDPVIANKNFISEQMKMWEGNTRDVFRDEATYNTERNKKMKEFHTHKSRLEKKLIDTIQNKIFEIKKSLKNIEDNNNFILPKHINQRYYNIYNINVFSYIKSIENYKLILLNNLRNVKNEIRFHRTVETHIKLNESKLVRIKTLYKHKNTILNEFLELNKGFMLIDAMFQQEIKNIKLRKKYWVIFKLQGFIRMIVKCCCCKPSSKNMLPVGYRHCTHVGVVDEDGRYLLDKVLRFNNVLTFIE